MEIKDNTICFKSDYAFFFKENAQLNHLGIQDGVYVPKEWVGNKVKVFLLEPATHGN